MNNRLRRPQNSTLFQNRLSALIGDLLAVPTTGNADIPTYESLLSQSYNVLSQFYACLDEPLFYPVLPVADTEPCVEDFNSNFRAIGMDLQVLFQEYENLEGLTLGAFNYMTARMNRLYGRLKQVSSSLADYILFSDHATKDSIFFGDSFTTTNRVDYNSRLLNAEQLEVNTAEGTVTLPVQKAKQARIVIRELPVINSNSNGSVGNQLATTQDSFHGDIAVILDGNADTWFEYERIPGVIDDGEALVLDFTVNLGTPQIINHIVINPNNFGACTQVQIDRIDTSLDGKALTSIKDDIPISGWEVQDEENVFALSPATSKYAGQGIYTFTPRKAKYIRFTLRQTTPYAVQYNGQTLLRYAIGIRDISLEALPFATKGELISTEFASVDEIRKLVLLANQNPISSSESALAKISHFISPDNGQSWYPIRPKDSVGIADTVQEVPELLDFNGSASGTITTSNPVKMVRYKVVMERFSDAFDPKKASDLARTTAFTTELHKLPITTPFTIAVQRSPIANSIRLVDPNYGSRGKADNPYTAAIGTGGRLFCRLPWKPVRREFSKAYVSSAWTLVEQGDEEVYVNGELWTRGDVAGAGSTDKVYLINYEDGTLTFGDGTNGKAVPSGAMVAFSFGEERIFPSYSELHIAKLAYPTVNDQEQIEVYWCDTIQSATAVLKKGARVHKLQPDIVDDTDYPIYFSDGSVFGGAPNPVDFVNGSDELTTAGDWSVDYANGVIYSYSPTSSSTDTTIRYFYRPRTKLSSSEWSFGDVETNGVSNSICISADKWNTITAQPELVPTGVKYFNLANMAVVKGTVFFTDLTTFAKEVAFVDGHAELLGAIQTSEEIAALGSGTVTFNLSLIPMASTEYAITFSDPSVFVEYNATPSTPGQYSVDRSTGLVTVITTGAVDTPGTVSYYYADPTKDNTGKYSINYDTGEVFTYDQTQAATYTAYQYTDFRVKYPIAREIPTADFEVDVQNKKLTLKDREILLSQRIPQYTATGTRDKYYQVSYKYQSDGREDLNSLEPYFSPVLKDYALKIMTKGRMF